MPAPSSSLIDPVIGHAADLAEDAREDPPGLLAVLARVADPRRRRGVRHRLAVILGLAVCAVLAGARSFAAIAEWAATGPAQMKVIHMTATRKTRRLVSGLAAGLLAAGTVLATAGVASAAATAARQTTCTPAGNYYLSSSSAGISYYLGTRNKASSGSAAILKPNQNATTLWTNIACTNGNNLLENRGLAMTSRATSSGANVTLQPPGNGGTGFASQQWFITCANPRRVPSGTSTM